jgi:hypothetical protein
LGTGAANAAAGNDARFSDQRVPTDGSVTNVKVAGNAGIAYSKLSLAGSIIGSDIANGTIDGTKISGQTLSMSHVAINQWYMNRASVVTVGTDGGSNVRVNFTPAFPNVCLGVAVVGVTGAYVFTVWAIDNAGFNATVFLLGPGAIPGENITLSYVAIGY